MRYAGAAPSGTANLALARFYDATANKGAYVAWMTTSDGSAASGYRLALPAAVSTTTLVTLTAGSPTGTEVTAAIVDHGVMLTVNETPVIVLFDGPP